MYQEMLSRNAFVRKPSWRATINLSNVLDPYDDLEQKTPDEIKEFAKLTAHKIKVGTKLLGTTYRPIKRQFPDYVDWEATEEDEAVKDIITRFEDLLDHPHPTIDDYNDVLQELYDIGDKYRIWVTFN